MKTTKTITGLSLAALLALTACGDDNGDQETEAQEPENQAEETEENGTEEEAEEEGSEEDEKHAELEEDIRDTVETWIEDNDADMELVTEHERLGTEPETLDTIGVETLRDVEADGPIAGLHIYAVDSSGELPDEDLARDLAYHVYDEHFDEEELAEAGLAVYEDHLATGAPDSHSFPMDDEGHQQWLDQQQEVRDEEDSVADAQLLEGEGVEELVSFFGDQGYSITADDIETEYREADNRVQFTLYSDDLGISSSDRLDLAWEAEDHLESFAEDHDEIDAETTNIAVSIRP
ncbi:hypothetical protein [Nesterenkonia aerolata]|uniref:Uncharacterized protein n=1 Tax=Nesterenkonia aerolata TaxID=3074079 RepID=A0ABU2DS73_9MICC|nr:hypothetical protein [Nesterenkonia sp. LY-0111]MDR8019226.1 hypothetical protein [Nesterenkonia sp. LY-0111]